MRLLRRTIKNYILYSALLLLVCTPLYYLAIRQLFINEMEEELFHHKNNFIETAARLETEKEIQLYQLINEEFILTEPIQWPIIDSLFTFSQYDSLESGLIPFRALRTGVTIQNKHYQLIIRESIVGNTKLVITIVAIQAVLLMLLLIGFILINRKLSIDVWGPFYVILEKLKQYQIDKDLSIELPKSSTSEFRDLSEVLVQLVNKSRNAYLNQKEFTENASHELQTPIAIFRSKLELLMQGKDITHDQAELISELLNATDRITRLNKSLLLLSKIENRQFISTQEISVKTSLFQTLELYGQLATDKELKINIEANSELLVKTNPILLDILLSNLISNAIRHTPEKNEITVRIDKRSLQISNAGAPLKNPEKIFQRFNRESRNSQGSGLGLAILKMICEIEGFNVNYYYVHNQHQFTITFH
jgi:signal transduction histidine kinase